MPLLPFKVFLARFISSSGWGCLQKWPMIFRTSSKPLCNFECTETPVNISLIRLAESYLLSLSESWSIYNIRQKIYILLYFLLVSHLALIGMDKVLPGLNTVGAMQKENLKMWNIYNSLGKKVFLLVLLCRTRDANIIASATTAVQDWQDWRWRG